MEVKAVLAGQIVESSGVVVLSSQQKVFSIHVDDVEVAFEFQGDDNEPALSSRLDGAKKVVVTLLNWSNPLGTSNIFNDIVVAEDRSVTIGIYVNTVGQAPKLGRTVSYSVTSRPKSAA